ncbi:phosphomannomutase/phosphoglucomutase, partial [Pseudomonas guariconensis]
AQAWADSQGASLRQALGQLVADTTAAARNPALADALNSGDPSRVQVAERGLGYWNAVVDAHLNLPGQAQQNSQRAAPMNFAALDMLRRAESGQKPAPEAYKVGQRWLVYSA